MVEATIAIGGRPIGRISSRLYGHFAEHLGRCSYGGLWVGPQSSLPNVGGFRADVVAALRELPVPLLRWPGGCYADHYHWHDGVGPHRTVRVGTSCGVRVEDDNSLGTHEFLALCELLGAEPYLAGNLGTGTLQELIDWMEYVGSVVPTDLARERAANGHADPWNVRLWGIGNETWDCGGRLDPAAYAREFRHWATMIRHLDPVVELVAVGLDEPWRHGRPGEADWNRIVLETLGASVGLVDHLSVHRYWVHGGPETDFGEADYYGLLEEAERTEALVEETARLIDSFDPPHPIGIALDEFGVWHPEARDWGPGEAPRRTPLDFEQANTLRDALAAGIALEGFHRQCNRLSMTNIAQVVNVLQAVIVTDGATCLRTPTYHAYALHRAHVGAEALPADVRGGPVLPSGRSAVSATASRGATGAAITLMNRHLYEAAPVRILGMPPAVTAAARVLTADAPNATNTPADPERVALRPLEVVIAADGTAALSLPPHSMATLELSGEEEPR